MGHIASGKTTELRRYAGKLNDSRRFYVVEVDVLAKLDRKNLLYADGDGDGGDAVGAPWCRCYSLGKDALKLVREWFVTAIQTRATNRELSAELKAGTQAGVGIPGLGKLFAGFTAALKTGPSQMNDRRQEIRNGFTTPAVAFGNLIRTAKRGLVQLGRAERVLFLVDGTDKMRGEDTQQFFVQDAGATAGN